MAAEFFRRWNEDALVEARRTGLIKLLVGRTLIDRWEMWRPAIHRAHGPGVYPMCEGLVQKLRTALDAPDEAPEQGVEG